MSTKNEVKYIKERFLSDPENSIHYLGQSKKLGQIDSIFRNLNSHEHPDGYARLGNQFILFEHFEFDSSNRKEKLAVYNA